ncbi:hypothetical protein E4665_06785 [Sporolactobacillus shoreae]|uniref:Uncharacterized protein n=1 Tax=Sporolactobacillus shoreae TaxID=1465501 RepID=A0A4Z0GPU6_9BACL|nr:hypothetical protein [Sporolactobacillus shoreae]TGA99018.1 hypothetical protein E4665_06785 [Sporolactobacillus shoreae]
MGKKFDTSLDEIRQGFERINETISQGFQTINERLDRIEMQLGKDDKQSADLSEEVTTLKAQLAKHELLLETLSLHSIKYEGEIRDLKTEK